MPTQSLVTVEELLSMPDGEQFELDAGRLVRMNPPGAGPGEVVVRIAAAFYGFAGPRGLGRVFVESGFTLHRNPDTVRGPDVSFIGSGHAGIGVQRGFITGGPDIAVEIVSPENTRAQLRRKMAEYLGAGTKIGLIVDLDRRTIEEFRPDTAPAIRSVTDRVDFGPVLAGLAPTVAELLG